MCLEGAGPWGAVLITGASRMNSGLAELLRGRPGGGSGTFSCAFLSCLGTFEATCLTRQGHSQRKLSAPSLASGPACGQPCRSVSSAARLILTDSNGANLGGAEKLGIRAGPVSWLDEASVRQGVSDPCWVCFVETHRKY